MKTEVYESDPFTPKKGRLIATLDTEYRFQKGDEVYFDDEPSRLKVRVIDVRIPRNDMSPQLATMSAELAKLRGARH